jgi:hypothetical protein
MAQRGDELRLGSDVVTPNVGNLFLPGHRQKFLRRLARKAAAFLFPRSGSIFGICQGPRQMWWCELKAEFGLRRFKSG